MTPSDYATALRQGERKQVFLTAAADLIESQAQRIRELETKHSYFRARVFGLRRVDDSYHNTGCTIWGDDGQGGTTEGFTQPLPCNCGALINFAKSELEGAAITDAAVERAIGARSVIMGDAELTESELPKHREGMRCALEAALRSESHQASAEDLSND